MSDKRVRSLNFSSEEKLYCLNLIKKYKHIIESKETGVISWKQKENVWKIIERDFNAQSSVFRSAEVIKRFYNNKKKETRKIAACVKNDLQATGGGPSSSTFIDPIFDLTLDIMNKKTVFGLGNQYDGDAEIAQVPPLEVKMDEDSDTMNPAPNIEETIIIQIASDNDAENDMQGTPSTSVPDVDWSACTSASLRTPVHKKLKQKMGLDSGKEGSPKCNRRAQMSKTESVALRYEEVATIKKDVLDMQLKLLQSQFQHEEELFELKKKSCLLDIKIKEEQLKALQYVNKQQ